MSPLEPGEVPAKATPPRLGYDLCEATGEEGFEEEQAEDWPNWTRSAGGVHGREKIFT